jgi:hypothetical protein
MKTNERSKHKKNLRESLPMMIRKKASPENRKTSNLQIDTNNSSSNLSNKSIPSKATLTFRAHRQDRQTCTSLPALQPSPALFISSRSRNPNSWPTPIKITMFSLSGEEEGVDRLGLLSFIHPY